MKRIIKHRDGAANPAIMKCDCGAEIVLYDPLDNFCDSCPRCYNSSGQEVVCSRDCDAVGNPYADYMDM